MGRDKASIEFEGITLIERTADTMKEAGATDISVVLSQGSELTVPNRLSVLRDEFPDAGALAGIHAALKHCKTELAFVAACDLPLASSDLARMLVEDLENSKAECAIPAQPGGRQQPLFGAYRRDPALSAANEILEDAGASYAVAALTDALRTRVLSFEVYSGLENSRHLLTNVNTPEELEAAVRKIGRRI